MIFRNAGKYARVNVWMPFRFRRPGILSTCLGFSPLAGFLMGPLCRLARPWVAKIRFGRLGHQGEGSGGRGEGFCKVAVSLPSLRQPPGRTLLYFGAEA